jgi:RNA polymerase sigma-70 factor (ECF subfamily)
MALPDASSEALVRKLVGPDLPPDEAADQAERTLRVRRALAGLSADDREVLLMRNYEALQYAEIAALLDVSQQAARQRHGRALARLSHLLSEAGDGESVG